MHKFLDKAKSFLDGQNDDHPHEKRDQSQQQPVQGGGHDRPSGIQQPTEADVIRYRYHHGANLGTVFVQERWLCGSMWPEGAQGSAELACVQAWVKQDGEHKARERFERHWRDWIHDDFLDWLAGKSGGQGPKPMCTTVRLPIGYFTLGPPYCKGTPFEPFADVYQNAWEAVKHIVKRCHERGIGVLMDFHALPGGANNGDHSGTNSGKAELWGSSKNRDLATRCICFIVQQCKNMEGIAGVQIINEAEYNAKHMYDWYDDVLKETKKIDDDMPIYISDAWDLGKCASWTQGRNKSGVHSNPVVIDTHLYWCFSDADKQKSAQQITEEVGTKLGGALNDGSVHDKGAVQAVVGEYSCVLADDSWNKSGGKNEQLVQQFGNAQSGRYQQRAGGSFFWTGRMDWMPGGEWGFKAQTQNGAIIPTHALTFPPQEVHNRVQHAHSQMQQRKQQTVGSHVAYWDGQGGNYEHWRFEQGYDVGWNDAVAFFEQRAKCGHPGADRIGMLDMWCLKRLRDSGQSGRFVWEFEQGLRQGVKDFHQCVGS